MPPFPWDSLKAETLRSICKDLGVNLGKKRKREDMVTLLKEVETRGVVNHQPELPVVSNDTAPKPVAKPPSHDHEDSDSDAGDDMNSLDEMDTGDHPGSDSESTCCVDGLSPRMKFILSTVAAVASDLVRDTGELAGELGHVGGVYMTQYIPMEELPRGKKAAALWVDGLSTIYGVIYKMFKAGVIPTEPALEEALGKIPQSDRILVGAYTKHTELEHALYALVQQAKEEWEDEFQEAYCHDKKWVKLPACAKHDLDWTMAEDILVG